MTFTPESPTAPGFYLWKKRLDSSVHHLYEATDLADLDEWRKLGGFWCMLVLAEDTVPKVEVELAYEEGWCDGSTQTLTKKLIRTSDQRKLDYGNSRAKRVVTGRV